MTSTFETIRQLLPIDDWRASDHALQRAEDFGIMISDLAKNIELALVVEDYPSYYAGPCVLVLQSDRFGPLHALWGLELGTHRPAILITTYRPDTERWQADNRTRKP